MVLEKTLESPLDCKEIQPVHSEDQPWDFFGRNDAKAESPVLWPPLAKSWLIGKGSVAGRDWGQEEKGMTEDEMAGWHHWLYGHESEWTPGVGEGQGGLACCDSWGCKESDMTKRLNWTKLKLLRFFYQSLIDMGDRKYPTPVVFSSLHVGKRNTQFKPHIAFLSYLHGKRNWEVSQYTQYNDGHRPAAQAY